MEINTSKEIQSPREADWRKYAYTFIITISIFITAIILSNYFSQKRINELQNIESQIAIDILSSETQFSLLSELSCNDINNSFLSRELSELGTKLDYTEQARGVDDPEVINLKRYYSLLQIKDFLLMQRVSEKCGDSTLSIIYFYSNKDGKCDDCEKEGYVLTRLREEYPELRVYSFDYDIDLSAIDTLINIYSVEGDLPALVVKGEVHYGFQSIEDVKDIIPELREIDKERAESEETTATSTEN